MCSYKRWSHVDATYLVLHLIIEALDLTLPCQGVAEILVCDQEVSEDAMSKSMDGCMESCSSAEVPYLIWPGRLEQILDGAGFSAVPGLMMFDQL